MNVVTELDTDILNGVSQELWKEIQKIPLDYYNGVAVLEDYAQLSPEGIEKVKTLIPWLSGKVGCIIFEANSTAPIHCDNHEDVKYKRSLNVLVESDGDNHVTRYYNYRHGYWDPKKYGALYNRDESDLEKIFEFTVKKPTLFYNQILHDVYNYGNKKRAMIMWLIDSSVSDEEIFSWARKSNIDTRVLFDVS